MKTPRMTFFILAFLSLLAWASCEEQAAENSDLAEIPNNIASPPADTCSSDSGVGNATARKWQGRFQVWAKGRFQANPNSSENSYTEHAKWFPMADIETLFSNCNGCQSIRVYPALENPYDPNSSENEIGLVLTMVNGSCSDSIPDPDSIFMRTFSNSSYISEVKASDYINNWASFAESQNGLFPIQNYTYEKSSFDTLLDLPAESEIWGLSIDFGLHQVKCGSEPGNGVFEGPYDSSFCDGDTDSTLVIDLVLEPIQWDSATGKPKYMPRDYINFAQPCPNWCKGNSLSNQ